MSESKAFQETSRQELGRKLKELIVEKQQVERHLSEIEIQVKQLKKQCNR